jgi:ferredoxin
MKVSINGALCTGHGRCYSICPKVFDEDEAGHCVLLITDVPAELEAKTRQAADNCPEHAIETTD